MGPPTKEDAATRTDDAWSAFANLDEQTSVYVQPVGLEPFRGANRRDNLGSAAQQLSGGWQAFTGLRLIARTAGPQSNLDVLRERSQAVWPVEAFRAEFRQNLPTTLADEVEAQIEHLSSPRAPLELGPQGSFSVSRPRLMGILNVTPDSFSDGGETFEHNLAVNKGADLVQDGAAIIDVGGESTRPGSEPVPLEEELRRVVPVVERLNAAGHLVSIDTRKATVMDQALQNGARILNDVSALTHDAKSLDLAAKVTAPVVLMHAQGEPQTMQVEPAYEDVVLDVFDFLASRLAVCEAAGIGRDRVILDPGIGFGKTVQHNLTLLNNLSLFHALGCPLLLGASRKRFIGALSQEEAADQRLAGSLAAFAQGYYQGVQIFRVHDVAESTQMLSVLQGLSDAAMLAP